MSDSQSRRTAAEPMMKGAVIREFVHWYEVHQGTDRLRLIAERVPVDLRSFVDPDEPVVKILASSWYPVRLVHSILDTLAEGRTEAQIAKMVHDANRWVVKRGMNSVYRFLLEKIVTPEMYAKHVSWMWRQIHTTGERAMTVDGTHAESVVSRWPGHHPVLCLLTIETMCAILETTGCKNIQYKRRSCVARGGRDCTTTLSWDT